MLTTLNIFNFHLLMRFLILKFHSAFVLNTFHATYNNVLWLFYELLVGGTLMSLEKAFIISEDVIEECLSECLER